MAEYERIALVKQQVFVYKLPPRVSNKSVRASEWNLANPSWKGRMKVISKGKDCIVKLEDKITGELFASCPVDTHPGVAVEPVSDSSRYFILRLLDPSGHHAFVGLGFEDRGDAFDFNVSLQDHFKQVKQSEVVAQEAAQPVHYKDYSLKEGQRITVNINKKRGEEGGAKEYPSQTPTIGLTSGGALVPPPLSGAIRPLGPPPTKQQQQSTPPSSREDWGDFTSFNNNGSTNKASDGGKWVQF